MRILDLAITSALWLPVQAYYAVHGFGMAFLVAKNGANNLPLTHGAFMRTAGQSLVRDLLPSPFSAVLQDGYRGYQYLRPELVNVDDDRDYIGSGFNLQGLNATTRDAHIAQCLDTTRRRLIDEKLVKERAKARRKGKRRGILRRERQIEIARSVAPTTVLDYLYRARIKSNYEDPTMYSESPEDAAALLALVRNTQKLTVMLCAFVVAALRRTIDEPAQNQLVEMRRLQGVAARLIQFDRRNALMDFELITTLVGSGESETLEFKATTGSRREAARTVNHKLVLFVFQGQHRPTSGPAGPSSLPRRTTPTA